MMIHLHCFFIPLQLMENVSKLNAYKNTQITYLSDGTNFYNITEAARYFRLIAKCFKVDDIEKLKQISTPFIVQLNNKNYLLDNPIKKSDVKRKKISGKYEYERYTRGGYQ